MSVSTLKLDELPIVHAVFIYANSNINGNETAPLCLQDTSCSSRKIVRKIEKKEGQSLCKLGEEMRKKALRSRKRVQLKDSSYELYALHASSEDCAVFLVEGDTLFTKTLQLQQEKENSLLILPFLDSALLKFLGRSQIYGSNIAAQKLEKKQRRRRQVSSRSMHILTSKETFSLEEVFRDLDVDGNGSIDLEEWKHGFSMMAGIDMISEDDMELVFEAITGNGDEIKWRDFYSFFDGKQLTSRRHKASLSAQLNLPNFGGTKANLGTLDEEQQEHNEAMAALLIGDEKEKEDDDVSEAKYIQKVKQAIRECLNLGQDSYLLSGSRSSPFTPASSAADAATFHCSQNSSSSATGIDIESKAVSQSLLRLDDCEDLLDLMEHNLYQCADQSAMTKWENRYKSHKLRINNFRKILNAMLSRQIISMRDENNTLLKQLENIRDGGGFALREMADLHHQQLSSLTIGSGKKSKKNKHSRSGSSGMRSTSKRSFGHNLSDDDNSSVDSEVNLVYTKGTKLSSKETESLLNRVKFQKKEIKKLVKDKKSARDCHKDEIRKLKRMVDQQGSKMKSYEKIRSQLVAEKQSIQDQLRKLQGKGKKSNAMQRSKDQSAQSQRQISVLQKQIKNLSNELEAEQERKRNLQRKLTRVISSTNKDKDNEQNSVVSQNKLRRLEKERNRFEQECGAKTKKMDEMFLKLGRKERKSAVMAEENAELKAKLGSYNTQMKEINRRTMELQSVTDDRDRALADIDILHRKMMKLNEKIAKLKSRNRKMKDRIKNLLLTIDEYDKLATHSRKLINDLTAIQRELNLVEIESTKYQNENATLNERIAELKGRMREKKAELDNTTVKLEKFRDDLSAEYSIIRTLQEQIEEKESAINELNEHYESEQNKNLSEKEILENEREELSMELIRSKAQIEQSQKIIDRYKSKCKKYEAQIENLNERLINYEQNEVIKLKSHINSLQNKVETRNDEIKLLKSKNEKLMQELAAKKDISSEIKEKNDEIDDLMNRIELLQSKLSGHQQKFKNKCNDFDELSMQYKKLEKSLEENQTRIKKLNYRIKEFSTKTMQEDDDTKLKLKQYNVQIITIEENKKLIQQLRQKIGEYKTKWQLEQEALDRHKKATKQLEEDVDENEKLIKKQKKKIKSLQNELDTSGYGDSKQKSTLSLLRKNVRELESILGTKNFEIRKLKNNLKASGQMTANISDTSAELKQLRKSNDSLQQKYDKLSSKSKKYREELQGNKELLNVKNNELTQLNIEVSELKEVQQRMEREEKENESLNKQVSVIKNETNQQVEKLTDKIQELSDELNKVRIEKQRKIDSLEAELADKDSVLLQIGKQVGTEFHNSVEIEQ